jgi:hypothetical protein
LIERGSPQAYQPNRAYPASPNSRLCECAINPTHCFRTVSQRGLNVPTRFLSQGQIIAAGDNLWEYLFFNPATGAFGPVGVTVQQGVTFLDANATGGVFPERSRIYDLVLFALRADVTVLIADAAPFGAGNINVSTLQARLEEAALQYIYFKSYYSSDRSEPWIDRTSLSYFNRPNGEYVLIPPVKYIEREPSCELGIAPAEKGTAAQLDIQFPNRDVHAQASIIIDALFMPDPNTCPDVWPGEICPRETIGNTPWYKGVIENARR